MFYVIYSIWYLFVQRCILVYSQDYVKKRLQSTLVINFFILNDVTSTLDKTLTELKQNS